MYIHNLWLFLPFLPLFHTERYQQHLVLSRSPTYQILFPLPGTPQAQPHVVPVSHNPTGSTSVALLTFSLQLPQPSTLCVVYPQILFYIILWSCGTYAVVKLSCLCIWECDIIFLKLSMILKFYLTLPMWSEVEKTKNKTLFFLQLLKKLMSHAKKKYNHLFIVLLERDITRSEQISVVDHLACESLWV